MCCEWITVPSHELYWVLNWNCKRGKPRETWQIYGQWRKSEWWRVTVLGKRQGWRRLTEWPACLGEVKFLALISIQRNRYNESQFNSTLSTYEGNFQVFHEICRKSSVSLRLVDQCKLDFTWQRWCPVRFFAFFLESASAIFDEQQTHLISKRIEGNRYSWFGKFHSSRLERRNKQNNSHA